MRLVLHINISVHNYYSTNFILTALSVLPSVMFFAAPRLKTHRLKIFTLELRGTDF